MKNFETSRSIPKLLFIAATHGNETFSIPVLKDLEKNYPKSRWNYDWMIGNPRAVDQQSRFVEADLNRSAPGDLDSLKYEERRAAELMSIAQNFDMVVDIHGTVSPCEMVKIIPKPSVENLMLASLFPELINIIWYSARSEKSGPPTQFMDTPALEIECDMNAKNLEDNLYQLLVRALMIKQSMSWINIVAALKDQDWFQVTGRAKDFDPQAKELMPLQTQQGEVYPFLTNQYRQVPYYLLKKIGIEDLFKYE